MTVTAVKAKNVVTLSVDDVFAQPGIGTPGVSSTDTNHGLFIGGHPRINNNGGVGGRQGRAGRRRAMAWVNTKTPYVGCIKDIVIEGNPLNVNSTMRREGDVWSHVCPTI